MNILEAISDENLFAPLLRDPATWSSWRTFLAALFGLSIPDDELELYRQCTQRADMATTPYRESWLVIGRRGGKSFTLALIAVYLSCFKSYTAYLAPGERATVMVIAADRRQARVIFRYIEGILSAVPMLAAFIERSVGDVIELNNGISIEVATASYRVVRGYTIAACLCDEIAFWRSDEGSSSPDTEILAAIRPAMATIPTSMLLCASSPYARRGSMWRAYRKHFGTAGAPVLVWQAPTRTMNPTIDEALIADAMADDAASANAEYMAEFRVDIENYVSREVIEACTVIGRYELPPLHEYQYYAFVDPSGGSADSFTLAIGHEGGDYNAPVAVLDAIREVRPPFSPDAVVQEFAELLQRYNVVEVTGDRYAGEWPQERFRIHGIEYVTAEKPKSDIYRELLPSLNASRVELLDNSRLHAQLLGLERRTARGGRDSIDHAPGAHDDVANAAAGVLTQLGGQAGLMRMWEILGMPTLPVRR